ncbi:deoxyribonuclease-1-like 1 isoform X2 [Austrofundulus limnaeus]|uniref:Deoxyribonuclease-1-like 1 n=1 Tax=Austrofundulus limnaeus TaxID=52670 RepID=A0A2I4BVF4_AUSLI|nr:PREDICTED: deoxyribonuclease-1-like isoform X2 [Austrofundulus limnaeus]
MRTGSVNKQKLLSSCSFSLCAAPPTGRGKKYKAEFQQTREREAVEQKKLTSHCTAAFSFEDMRTASLLFLLSFLLGVNYSQAGSEFRICAFNLHHFGESKAKKSDVMLTLARIISRCDVCLLQEVRDSKGTAVPQLIQTIKSYDHNHQYQHVASVRLGRSETYQEQYVFVYRSDTVTVTDQYQYPDDLPGDEDAFSREPFVVRLKAPRTAIKDFVLIAQHTTPTNTTKELDSLYDVLQRVRKMWKTENVMLLGDFNADCGYLAKKNRKNVRLITDPSLHWLVPENSDTTVKLSTSCSYDRIVVHGDTFNRAVVPSSAQPFNFQKEYKLTEEQALDISDHYPVEVLLRVVSSRAFPRGSSFKNHFSLFAFIPLVLQALLW